jgi:hypothetical protein
VYNPQIQRELSQVGQQGLTGPPSGGGGGAGYGGLGNFGHGHGNQAGESLGQTFQNLNTVASALTLASPNGWWRFSFSFGGFGSEGSSFFSGSIPIPFLSSLFGGGGDDDQPIPPRRKNPIWDAAAVSSDLTPDQHTMVYPSIDAAVRAAQAPAVNRFRTNGGREAYGYVHASGNGFTYSGPFDSPGEFGGHVDVPPGFVASYHTHSQSGFLSKKDEVFLNQTGKPLYILTVPSGDEPASNGGIFRYMPGKPEEMYMLP